MIVSLCAQWLEDNVLEEHALVGLTAANKKHDMVYHHHCDNTEYNDNEIFQHSKIKIVKLIINFK